MELEVQESQPSTFAAEVGKRREEREGARG